MSPRGSYRRHSRQFRLQLCQDIRSGAVGRCDAAQRYNRSTDLLQLWLTQYDRSDLTSKEAEASVIAEYEAEIGAGAQGQPANDGTGPGKKRHACAS
jgi:transposase